jgi:hypothetical protein
MSKSTQSEETTEEVVLVSNEDVENLLDSTTNQRLQEQLTSDVVNPIELARFLNCRPQMVYQYVRKGKIARDTNNTQKIVIPRAVAVAFAQGYLNRKAVKAAKVEAELAGES